jgi:transcriptional regulator with XRE-family HTH domain
MPRPSVLRHPLARLRQIAGLSQKELAAIVGRSTPTIQAIELGKLKLSEELAEIISAATGVSRDYLLAADPKAKPLAEAGGAFTQEKFFEQQSDKGSWGKAPAKIEDAFLDWFVAMAAVNLKCVAESATRSGQLEMFLYSFYRRLRELEEKFGLQPTFAADSLIEFASGRQQKFWELALEKENDPAVARRIAYMDEHTKEFRGEHGPFDKEMTRAEAVEARKKSAPEKPSGGTGKKNPPKA